MTKLHLGCGQKYLDGYLNIDFPISEHSVQTNSIADEHHDILNLSYAAETISEVRLHHVFEHFDRPTAAALLGSWNSWLKKDGVLRIEVPDFEKTAKAALSSFKNKNKKKVALRHLFGSHEAFWAVHYEGYSEWLLKDLLESFGFSIQQFLRNQWQGTYNIEIIAIKKRSLSNEEAEDCARHYLSGFILDESEKPLLEVWISQFLHQLGKTSK
jgi:predicted SAM-dependent methyltransferase